MKMTIKMQVLKPGNEVRGWIGAERVDTEKGSQKMERCAMIASIIRMLSFQIIGSQGEKKKMLDKSEVLQTLTILRDTEEDDTTKWYITRAIAWVKDAQIVRDGQIVVECEDDKGESD